MSWIYKIINWTKPANNSGHYKNGVYQQYTTSEPSAVEIANLKQKIKKFENHLNLEEFKRCIIKITKTIVNEYDMGEFIDINKMADSAYDNFMARLYQITKYINKNPNNTYLQANIYLKFDTVNVVEYYPMLINLIVYGEECSIGKRGHLHNDLKKKINKTINDTIYQYALSIIPEIKKKHFEFNQKTTTDKQTELALSQIKSVDNTIKDTKMDLYSNKTRENYGYSEVIYDSLNED
jgi:hypothetical protein